MSSSVFPLWAHDDKHTARNLTNKSKSLIHDQNIIDRGLNFIRSSLLEISLNVVESGGEKLMIEIIIWKKRLW